MVIDFHTHVFPAWLRDNRSEYLQQDPCFAALYSSPKAEMVTAEELLQSMDRAGVDVSVVLNIDWKSHELSSRTNDYILEAVSRYPRRLVGFCAIQPTAGEAALREMERCARAGARGIGEMRPDIQGYDLGDEAVMGALVRQAEEWGLILLTHASEPVGHPYGGKGSVTLDMLYRFLVRFPEQPIVFAHWGGGLPFYALMPEVAKVMEKAYFDTAATPFLYRAQVFPQVLELVGEDKVLFGSDYPLIPQERVLRQIRSQKLPPAAEAKILGHTAQRVLGLWN